jgi:hypothetical protein
MDQEREHRIGEKWIELDYLKGDPGVGARAEELRGTGDLVPGADVGLHGRRVFGRSRAAGREWGRGKQDGCSRPPGFWVCELASRLRRWIEVLGPKSISS